MKTKSLQVFLVLCCLVLSLSCEKEEQLNRNEESIKTVSLDQALEVMETTQQKISAKSNSNFITSISKEINYESITNTEQELAVITVATVYKDLQSRIVLLEIEGELQSSILSINTFNGSTSENFSGEILITDLNGHFINGLRIENNIIVSNYIQKDENTNSNNLSFNIIEAKSGCENDCPFSVCSYCDLDEVVISAPRRQQPSYISLGDMFPQQDMDYYSSSYEYNYFGGGGGGSGNPDLDSDNKKPCPGDPVKNPKIAEQEVSGIEGGRYGCTRTGGVCDNSQEGKDHGGTDILNDYGEPIYAMFDGVATAVQKYFAKGAGWISYQTATVNGQQISIQYFHLQENNRVSGSISAGDIIGYQGDSGNLAGAIASGAVESHVHIKIKDKYGNTLDPEDFMSSNLTSNINNCN